MEKSNVNCVSWIINYMAWAGHDCPAYTIDITIYIP